MKFILSPAKKMRADDGTLPSALPCLLPETQKLLSLLQSMSPQQLQTLWRCNDSIAALNLKRIHTMDLRRPAAAALYAYDGIQYTYMAPQVFTEQELDYVQEHLRILYAFYGVLRPLDGVALYRLEMQTKLAGEGFSNLYAFWGDHLAKALGLAPNEPLIDLASAEYSKAVLPHLSSQQPVIRCRFCQWSQGKLVEKGVYAKMARGEMIRFLAETQAQSPLELQHFNRQGYRFMPEYSTPNLYTFLQNSNQ